MTLTLYEFTEWHRIKISLLNIKFFVTVKGIMELSSNYQPVLINIEQLPKEPNTISRTKTNWKKFHKVFKEDLDLIPT